MARSKQRIEENICLAQTGLVEDPPSVAANAIPPDRGDFEKRAQEINNLKIPQRS